MNKRILNTGVQNFIEENLNTDIMSVLLKKPYFKGISNKELAQQLESRKKSEKKLPTWFGTSQIYFPNRLNIEQTSSEITARYKSEIPVAKSLVDITGGWGVDSYFFSKKIEKVTHCEIDEDLSEIASHNFKTLGAANIKTISQDGIKFLKNSEVDFDWIYADPARRNTIKGKVFKLSDCEPDITVLLAVLFKRANNLLIKTSPLLDFSIGISELRFVKEIHVVAVNNEVKELLWVLKKNYRSEILVKTINLTKTGSETFDFHLSEEKIAASEFSSPLSYIYEPNAAILKSGAFKLLGTRFGIKKLHAHSHLYTSDLLIDFPGRRFEVLDCLPYTKHNFKKLGISKANITTRNFPETVADLRKRFKISDGGNVYLFFTTDYTANRIILNCSKI